MNTLTLLTSLVVSLGACAHYSTPSQRESFETNGRSKAAFDLQCPAERLEVIELGDWAMGVRGCDKQARYQFVNNVGWVMNAGSQAKAEPPATR